MQDAEQRYNQATAASLDAMLAQTLGVGKAQVLVYANMNVDQTTKESLEYGKTGTPLAQSKSLETLAGNGASARHDRHRQRDRHDGRRASRTTRRKRRPPRWASTKR